MRVILDANVYLSALFSPEGLCAQILRIITSDQRWTLVMTESICAELKVCLSRPKILKSTRRSEDQLVAWLNAIVATAVLVDSAEHIRGVCRDPNDDMYLSAAVVCLPPTAIVGLNNLHGPKYRVDVDLPSAAFSDINVLVCG